MADTPTRKSPRSPPPASEEAPQEEAGGTEAAEAKKEADAPGGAEKAAAEEEAPPAKAPPQELASGTVVDLGVGGKVTVEDFLGRGGMAEVYAGVLTTAEGVRQRIALKRVRRGVDERMAGRLVDEARVQACVAHRNVARIHGLIDVGDDRFILMEYVEGRSLPRRGNLSPRGGGEEAQEEAYPGAVLCQGLRHRLLIRAPCLPR